MLKLQIYQSWWPGWKIDDDVELTRFKSTLKLSRFWHNQLNSTSSNHSSASCGSWRLDMLIGKPSKVGLRFPIWISKCTWNPGRQLLYDCLKEIEIARWTLNCCVSFNQQTSIDDIRTPRSHLQDREAKVVFW